MECIAEHMASTYIRSDLRQEFPLSLARRSLIFIYCAMTPKLLFSPIACIINKLDQKMENWLISHIINRLFLLSGQSRRLFDAVQLSHESYQDENLKKSYAHQ